MGLKVAIIGMAESCSAAPWNDPDWEKWGLPWHPGRWATMDRLFEVHDEEEILNLFGQSYFDKLKDCPVLYVQHPYEGLNATPYPLKYVAKAVGREYFTSSVAYMIALAIHEGAEEIALYGVDITENEYGQQRPCIEYLLGVAVGRGIKVSTQETSLLFTYENDFGYQGRYGWRG